MKNKYSMYVCLLENIQAGLRCVKQRDQRSASSEDVLDVCYFHS